MMERCCGVTQAFVSRAFHHVSVSLYRLGAPPRSPRIGVATRTIARASGRIALVAFTTQSFLTKMHIARFKRGI